MRWQWTWDEAKNRENSRKHGLSFEAAQYVFADPLALSRIDPFPDEDRWQTVGLVGQLTVLVVHTWPVVDPVTGEETGRIISARKATIYERRATIYERRAYEEETF
jgi:uncharacterized protein